MLAQLLVELRQLGGQRVGLPHVGFDRLTRFVVQQLELGRELAKACRQAVGIAQKAAALHGGGRVAGQIACRFKEQVHRRGQADALVAHHVDQAIDIGQQRLLALELALAVAQVRLDKSVVLTTHRVKAGARAHVAATNQTRLVGADGHVLTAVPLGVDVGDVVRHRGQRPLVGRNARAANREHVTHERPPSRCSS